MSGRTESPTQPLGIALVGCGQIVTHHLEHGILPASHNNNANAFDVRALCDPSSERRQVLRSFLEQRHRLSSTSSSSSSSSSSSHKLQDCDSVDDLVYHDPATGQRIIDVVLIAVPHDLHESLTRRVFATLEMAASAENEKNKHHGDDDTGCLVVLEKPLGPTREACHALVRLSTELNSNTTGSIHRLFVAEQSPYWPAIVQARHEIASGSIGTVVSASSYYYESMRDNVTSGSVQNNEISAASSPPNTSDKDTAAPPPPPPTKRIDMGWRGSVARSGGGILLDGGLHWLRPLRELCGTRVARVVGVTRTHLTPDIAMEGESLGHALVEMEPQTQHASNRSSSTDNNAWLQQPPHSGPLVCTYSCHMLATAPMAHDACPYVRVTGTRGELVVHGNGLNRTTPNAGGLRLYNDEHPEGVERLPTERTGGFFLGFGGLWRDILQTCRPEGSAVATSSSRGDKAHCSVVRAADDVKVILALYASARSREWEKVEYDYEN